MLASLRGDAYQVRLPVFEGPLDLLLQLIEREKLDISAVSLAQVTDQFLVHVRALDAIQPSLLADFLVMAARLVFIKSRALLPQPAPDTEGDDEEDPGEALARQLREYKRFKEAAEAMRIIEEQGQHAYVRVPVKPELERRLDAEGMSLDELMKAAHAAFMTLPPDQPVGTVIAPFRITIRDQIRVIAEATAGSKPVTFNALLRHAHNRIEIVVTLLAVLELLKRRQVTVEQSSLFGEILIVPVEGTPITVLDEGNGPDKGDDELS